MNFYLKVTCGRFRVALLTWADLFSHARALRSHLPIPWTGSFIVFWDHTGLAVRAITCGFGVEHWHAAASLAARANSPCESPSRLEAVLHGATQATPEGVRLSRMCLHGWLKRQSSHFWASRSAMATVFPASQVLRCIQLADSTGEPIGNEIYLAAARCEPDGAMHRTAALSSLRSYI